MGTFHDTKDPLHGITVVAAAGETVYVGRCHARENGHIVLLDVDQHSEGEANHRSSKIAAYRLGRGHDTLCVWSLVTGHWSLDFSLHTAAQCIPDDQCPMTVRKANK